MFWFWSPTTILRWNSFCHLQCPIAHSRSLPLHSRSRILWEYPVLHLWRFSYRQIRGNVFFLAISPPTNSHTPYPNISSHLCLQLFSTGIYIRLGTAS